MNALFSAFNSFLGLSLSMTPFWLAPVCTAMAPDGAPMKCHYSGLFVVAMGVAIVVFSLLSLACRGRGGSAFLSSVVAIAAAVACLLVPFGVIPLHGHGWACGLCGNPAHACRAVFMPRVLMIAAALVIVNVASLILAFVAGKR